jgi:hypothetical protein
VQIRKWLDIKSIVTGVLVAALIVVPTAAFTSISDHNAVQELKAGQAEITKKIENIPADDTLATRYELEQLRSEVLAADKRSEKRDEAFDRKIDLMLNRMLNLNTRTTVAKPQNEEQSGFVTRMLKKPFKLARKVF